MRAAVRAAVVVLALIASACGKSPTSPSPTPAPSPAPPPAASVPIVDGQWTGRMVFTLTGTPNQSVATRVDLRQADRSIDGTWLVTSPADNDLHGTITGTLDGTDLDTQFRGTVTWDSPASDGSRCTGRATFAGPTGRAVIRWSASGFTMDRCNDPGFRDIVWTLSR